MQNGNNLDQKQATKWTTEPFVLRQWLDGATEEVSGMETRLRSVAAPAAGHMEPSQDMRGAVNQSHCWRHEGLSIQRKRFACLMGWIPGGRSLLMMFSAVKKLLQVFLRNAFMAVLRRALGALDPCSPTLDCLEVPSAKWQAHK